MVLPEHLAPQELPELQEQPALKVSLALLVSVSKSKTMNQRRMMHSGETVLLRDSEGKPAKWEMDFLPKAYKYQCKVTVDDEKFRGMGTTPEKAMRNAVNRYLRNKGRL